MTVTSIEWTDHSINPIRLRSPNGKSGHYCEKVSPGCKNCYSSRFQPRVGLPQFQAQRRNTEGLFLDPSKLEEVLRRKKPTQWFWCDMTDLFGKWVPFEWIAACLGVMAATPWHTHQVLTKRPGRALEFFEWAAQRKPTAQAVCAYFMHLLAPSDATAKAQREATRSGDWPLPNVWLGTSVEDQKTADERIPLLLQCPAAVRFVSAEPLLEAIDVEPYLEPTQAAACMNCGRPAVPFIRSKDFEWSERGDLLCPECDHQSGAETMGIDGLDWVIVGGESGPGARPCNVEWIRSIVRRCKEAGVACFVKQLGARSDTSCVHYGQKSYNKKGGDPNEWPEDLRVREFPEVQP